MIHLRQHDFMLDYAFHFVCFFNFFGAFIIVKSCDASLIILIININLPSNKCLLQSRKVRRNAGKVMVGSK